VEARVNLLGTLENGLFALAQVLRFPVIVLLWVAVAAAVFMAGGCVMEWLARRRERSGFDLNAWLDAGPVLAADSGRKSALPAPLRGLLGDVEAERLKPSFADGGLEHLVLEREERVRRTLNGSRLLVKVGPSLGLLGTLIPMGTALASLTAGNLEAMAGQMVVAFTTTIVGLAAGTVAYVIQIVRHGWVNETVREQRFLAERLAAELARDVPREVIPEERHHGTLSASAVAG
jgi:biopolymer transport protein ExbB/TolQ